MKIIYPNNIENHSFHPSVASIGFFDGVHLGHKYLIEQVVHKAKALSMASMIITFESHPMDTLCKEQSPQLLTALDEKIKRFQDTDIDYLVVLHFDHDLANYTTELFMKEMLRTKLNVTHLLLGYDNRFGKECFEDIEDYIKCGENVGIAVERGDSLSLFSNIVSSSAVRKALLKGNVAQARKILGYPYSITGKVVEGFKNGRKIGFPTANIQLNNPQKLLPADGVYAAYIYLGDETTPHKGMVNIGCRPTFNGNEQSIEAHIFDFEGNIYDQQLSIVFIEHIRSEKKFASLGALKIQLRADKHDVEQLLAYL